MGGELKILCSADVTTAGCLRQYAKVLNDLVDLASLLILVIEITAPAHGMSKAM
jgi:hypothetical protein